MKEISNKRVFGLLLMKLDRMGIPREKLVEGFPVSLAELTDRKSRMDWELFVPILKRFSKLVGGPAGLEDAGLLIYSTTAARLMGYVLSLVKEPKELYWALATMGGQTFFANIQFRYEDLGENRIRMTLSIPPEYTDSTEFFHVCRGTLGCVSMCHNMPNALVEMELKPRSAVYTITIPPSMTFFRRLKRAANALKGGRGVIEELSVFQRQISESYARLAEAQKKLMEHELKLKLFEQLANGSHMAALDNLAGGVGHEINNPLMVISLNAEQISAEQERIKGDTTLLKRIKAINEAKNRIAAIVSSLIAIGAGDAEEPPKPVRLASLLTDVLNVYATRCASSGIAFAIAPCDPNLVVLAQRALAGQALVHLLNNAFDAALEAEEKWIRIELKERESDVELRVMDSGAGVPDALGEQIFTPFFSTREVGHGVGLGLSLARKYIEMQGGKLLLDKSAASTCFTVTLEKDAGKTRVRRGH